MHGEKRPAHVVESKQCVVVIILVTKPLPRQIYYCLYCLFMSWSGIPASTSVDSVRKTTGLVSVTRTGSKLHRPQTYIQKTKFGTFHNRVVSEFPFIWKSFNSEMKIINFLYFIQVKCNSKMDWLC